MAWRRIENPHIYSPMRVPNRAKYLFLGGSALGTHRKNIRLCLPPLSSVQISHSVQPPPFIKHTYQTMWMETRRISRHCSELTGCRRLFWVPGAAVSTSCCTVPWTLWERVGPPCSPPYLHPCQTTIQVPKDFNDNIGS